MNMEAVAGKTRVMDDAFIADSGTDVTDAFRRYLRPLLGSGLPDAAREKPQRPTYDAKIVGEHALDGEMGLAGIGRTENGGHAAATLGVCGDRG